MRRLLYAITVSHIITVFAPIRTVTINSPPQLSNLTIALQYEVMEFTVSSPYVSISVPSVPGNIVVINGLKTNNATLVNSDPSAAANFTLSSFSSAYVGTCSVYFPAYVIVFIYGSFKLISEMMREIIHA